MPINTVNLSKKFTIESPLEFPLADRNSKSAFILKDAHSEIRNAVLMGKISEVNPRT